MFGPCPVVRIKYDNQDGFCEINESDFDADKHELFDVSPSAQKLSIGDLRDELTARGIEFDPAAKKSDLQALLDAAPAQ